MATSFESKTCGRCGGSGRYSYNQLDGDRCYGCRGTGLQLTKRGLAARARFLELTTAKAADVQPGWLLWDDTMGFKPKWLPVLKAGVSSSRYLKGDEWINYHAIETRRCSHGVFPDSEVRAAPDAETVNAKLAEALAYQATLTQAGKPAKRQPKATA